jgi:hypothetical protein
MLSEKAGFDFSAAVDACGGVLWLWHSKITPENRGLELVKPAERHFDSLPPYWRDYISVVTRRTSQLRPTGAPIEFDEIAAAQHNVALEQAHLDVIAALLRTKYKTVWVSEKKLLQTHTCALAEISKTLNIRGLFRTISNGSNPDTPNCFAFPTEGGGWAVYRFGPGVQEAETWRQDGTNYTSCTFNTPLPIKVAAKILGGSATTKGFSFRTTREAEEALRVAGESVESPDWLADRPAELIITKGKAILRAEKPKADLRKPEGRQQLEEEAQREAPPGWALRKDGWERLVEVKNQKETNYSDTDRLLRVAVTANNSFAGWYVHTNSGWMHFPIGEIRAILATEGLQGIERDEVIGYQVMHPWSLISVPFAPEYPGQRRWNRGAAQLAFAPSDSADPQHPHWDIVLSHCGKSLDEAILKMGWAKESGLYSGGDYLRAWIACLLREPFAPLPYLFLFGPENSGKSMLHEAISLLMTRGVVCANHALDRTDFNGELVGAVLAYIEEKDLNKKGVLEKIKQWVTSPQILIRQMRADAYCVPNTLHFIQVANNPSYCPIMEGDTRITALKVTQPETEIPKTQLVKKLIEEAPDFIRTLLDMKLPQPAARLRLPVIETREKESVQALNQDDVAKFLSEFCAQKSGSTIQFREFYARFREWLGPEQDNWSRKRVVIELASRGIQTERIGGKSELMSLSWKET